MFVIKTFYSSGGSRVSAERKYGKEFSVCGVPYRDTIYQTVKQLEEQEVCVINARCSSVRTEEAIGAAPETI
jgi:hypothetical protein